ncbi:hypothetical protein HELRODRAFT_166443 [Helobdella robusta]|uniref:SCY1-like protein 2 n=1 Tax=Helobdella robusta TaxID=6412 RepID=T1EY51_HELRO|nr:hypothetical protein HELRODRAFT_166443 [Helobdella robusta]ESN90740.1 hypothetical protein HELRODRAFT_166443 [Helobdella robusta]
MSISGASIVPASVLEFYSIKIAPLNNMFVLERSLKHKYTKIKYFDDPTVESYQMLDKVLEFNEAAAAAAMTSSAAVMTSSAAVMTSSSSGMTSSTAMSSSSAATATAMTTFWSKDFVENFAHNLSQVPKVNIYLLEKLDVLLKRCDDVEVRSHIFPLVFNSLASNNILCQEAALNTYPAMESYLDDSIIRRSILPKAKNLFLKATSMVILDEVLPFLIEIQCSDVDIAMSIVDIKAYTHVHLYTAPAIYKHLLSDRKFGLTHNLLATKVMPSLVPLTVYPGLSIYQFNSLMTLLHDMLAQIEQERINKMINELPPPQQYNDTQREPGANIKNNINNNNNTATTNQNASLLNQSFLHVDFNAYRPPSTPEFTIQSASESRDHLDNPGYKRHASFQSLGVRRLSQMSGQSDIRANAFSQHNPHIHISQASMTASLKDNVASLFSSSKHRDSIEVKFSRHLRISDAILRSKITDDDDEEEEDDEDEDGEEILKNGK